MAAGLLVVFGAVLLSARTDLAFARATAPIAARTTSLLSRLGRRGMAGQLLIGALLGALWTPCGGPTLGSSISLAAQRESLLAAAAVMAAYSLGAATPLLAFAYSSRHALDEPRRLAAVSRVGKPVIGFTLMVIGALTLMGADKTLEAVLVERMPPWLVDLTTRF